MLDNVAGTTSRQGRPEGCVMLKHSIDRQVLITVDRSEIESLPPRWHDDNQVRLESVQTTRTIENLLMHRAVKPLVKLCVDTIAKAQSTKNGNQKGRRVGPEDGDFQFSQLWRPYIPY